MMLRLILSMSISGLAGFVITGWIGRLEKPGWAERMFRISLALGLGLAVTSLIWFLWLPLCGSSAHGFAAVEASLLAPICVILLFVGRSRENVLRSGLSSGTVCPPWSLRLVSICFWVLLLSAIVSFLLLVANEPQGSTDAMSVWNMRARCLFRAGQEWKTAFSDAYIHADYPLLLPGVVARCWSYMGVESAVAPSVVALLFFLLNVGLTVSALSILRGKNQAMLAGLTLLASAHSARVAAYLQADIPLAFFMLATIVLLCFQDRMGNTGRSCFLLAGVACGFAAWTKNEGLLFLLSAVIAIVAPRFWKRSSNDSPKTWFFLVGCLPMIALVVYFKTQLVPPNDMISPGTLQPMFAKLTEWHRYLTVGKAFLIEFLRFGNYMRPLVPITAVLAAYWILVGARPDEKDKPTIAGAVIVFCLMCLGHFFVFITTPYSPQWHLDTALYRMFLQLWPGAVFVFFLTVATPEQALTRSGASQRKTNEKNWQNRE